MNVHHFFRNVLFSSLFVFGAQASAHFDTIPSGFRTKSSTFTDGTYEQKTTQQTVSFLSAQDCLPTDLQMQSVGLYDYWQERIYTGSVKGTVQFKKRVCAGEGRTPFVNMAVFTSSNSLRVRLISPSGNEVPLIATPSPLKANQLRIIKDFAKIGSTSGNYGKVTDVRAEAGEWTLELSSDGGAKVDMVNWGTTSNFWLLFPN